MLWKKKLDEDKLAEQEKQITAIKSQNTRRVNEAMKPIQQLNDLLAGKSGITLQIHVATGGKK